MYAAEPTLRKPCSNDMLSSGSRLVPPESQRRRVAPSLSSFLPRDSVEGRF